MEKLFIRFLIFFGWFQILSAQEHLCVFTITGNAKIERKALLKGDFITNRDKVILLANSKLMAIDTNGETYQISKKGKYTYKTILAGKKAKSKNNVTVNYLKFLWKEFSEKEKKETAIAGVFRGNVLMETPFDKAIVKEDKIVFKWKSEENTTSYYFFLRNSKTQELIKIETNGTALSFYNDFPLFQEGSELEWSVTTEAFPNVNNMPFYTFTKLNYEEYEKLKNSYQGLAIDLRTYGYNEEEIQHILCSQYKWCD